MQASSTESPQRPKAKVGHKKSRGGCLRCKQRRCDQQHPICGICLRLSLNCSWPDSESVLSEAGSSAPTKPSTIPGGEQSRLRSGRIRESPVLPAFQPLPALSLANEDIISDLGSPTTMELPESPSRRTLELRLMHNWLVNMMTPFPVNPSPEWTDIWSRELPQLAFQHNNLLYAILAFSATNLLWSSQDDFELYNARQSYVVLTLGEQRRAVSNTVEATADVAWISMLMLSNSFAMLQERTLEPYSPPLEWLQLGRGARTVMWLGIEAIDQGKLTSKLSLLKTSYPQIGVDESYFDPEMRRGFEGILTQELPSGDIWNSETQEAYEKTISYVGSIQKSINAGEPAYAICRRIQAFALVIPDRIVEFVVDRRPRALVILAHFFATVAQVKGVWWLGKDSNGVDMTATREVKAINTVIPTELRPHMVWPLDRIVLPRRRSS